MDGFKYLGKRAECPSAQQGYKTAKGQSGEGNARHTLLEMGACVCSRFLAVGDANPKMDEVKKTPNFVFLANRLPET